MKRQIRQFTKLNSLLKFPGLQYVRKARGMIQQMTDQRGAFFSLHVTLPRSGVVARHPSVGELPFLKGFSL